MRRSNTMLTDELLTELTFRVYGKTRYWPFVIEINGLLHCLRQEHYSNNLILFFLTERVIIHKMVISLYYSDIDLHLNMPMKWSNSNCFSVFLDVLKQLDNFSNQIFPISQLFQCHYKQQAICFCY